MKALEFVCLTLLSESKALFDKRMSKWRKLHFDIYHKILGRFERIGIEIENNKLKASGASNSLKPLKETLKSEGFDITDHFHNGFEITRLYELEDPRIFFEDLHKSISVLKKNGYSTLGALHLNVQQTYYKHTCTHFRYGNVCQKQDVTKKSSEKRNLFRAEYKKGIGFINPQCLIVQMLLYVSCFRKHEKCKGINRFEYHQSVLKSYPKILLDTSIDVSSYRKTIY